MEKLPEIVEIEARAVAAGVPVDDVLRRAGVATTTWWRWSEGHYEPRLATLRKVRAALDEAIADRAA